MMDIEQLKLILETVQAAGDGAKTIAILYIACMLVQPVLTCGVVVLLIVAASRTIRHIVNLMNVGWRVAEIIGKSPSRGMWSYGDTVAVLEGVQTLVTESEDRDGE